MSNELIQLIAQFVSYVGLALVTLALLLLTIKPDQVVAWEVAGGFVAAGAICMSAGFWLREKLR